jgi:acetyl esterase
MTPRLARHRVAAALAATIALALLAGCASANDATPSASSSSSTAKVVSGVVYTTVDGTALHLDACLPDSSTGQHRRAAVFVHGGSFDSGSRSDLRFLCVEAAKHGFVGFSLDYRLLPTKFPGAVHDVAAAIRFLRTSAEATRFGIDPKRISLIGASAGAVITAEIATGVPGSTLPKADIRSVVLLSGAYEIESDALPASLVTTGEQYLGCASLTACPAAATASAAQHVAKDDPPMLLMNSTNELMPSVQATRMSAALAKVGAAHELLLIAGTNHAEAMPAHVPRADAAIWTFLGANG